MPLHANKTAFTPRNDITRPPIRSCYANPDRAHTEPVFSVPDDAPYKGHSKIGLNNTVKIRFICNGECYVERAIESIAAIFYSPYFHRHARAYRGHPHLIRDSPDF